MGLLDRLRGKEEHVHFERDEAGRVVNVERTGTGGSRTPVSDQLINNVKKESKMERVARKQEYRKAFREAKHEATLARMKREGKRAGSMSMSERFGNVANSIQFKPYSTHSNYNPWGSMFDTGMSRPKTKKFNGGGKRYTIVGGKAYPIAGTKKKKSKRRSSGGSSWGGFDMTDNWGFMK